LLGFAFLLVTFIVTSRSVGRFLGQASLVFCSQNLAGVDRGRGLHPNTKPRV
jgi:hypothetical protein